jgi:hypothetical protein
VSLIDKIVAAFTQRCTLGSTMAATSSDTIDVDLLLEPADIFELHKAPAALAAHFDPEPTVTVWAGRLRSQIAQVEQALPSSTHAFFLSVEPTHQIHSIEDIILPPHKTCLALEDEFCNALAQEAQSIHHPTLHNTFLPLSLVHLWKKANTYNGFHRLWQGVVDWVEKTGTKEVWPSLFTRQMLVAIEDLPFFGGNIGPCLNKGACSFQHLISILASNKWLTDDVLGCLLCVVQHDSQLHRPTGRRVANAYLWPGIEQTDKPQTTQVFGREIANGSVSSVALPLNVQNTHWLFANVDLSNGVIHIGDSSPGST